MENYKVVTKLGKTRVKETTAIAKGARVLKNETYEELLAPAKKPKEQLVKALRPKKDPIPKPPVPEKEISKKPEPKIKLVSNPGLRHYEVSINGETGKIMTEVHPSASNCKLSTMEYAQSFLYLLGAKYIHDLVIHRETIFLTVTSKEHADRIKEECRVLYCIEVPIGYTDVPQYHILIQNPKGSYVTKVDKIGVTGYLRAATK